MPLRENRYFKEIAGLLLIKFCLLVAIRVLFFSPPENKPDAVVTTSAHLLGLPAAENRQQTSDYRSSHDQ